MATKDEIVQWINENIGSLKIYRDYNDEPFSVNEVGDFLESVDDAVRKAKAAGDNGEALSKVNPEEMLNDWLWEKLHDGYEYYESDLIDDAVKSLLEEFPDDLDRDEALDLIQEFCPVEYPMDEYLDDKYHTVVTLDTGDANYDFTLNTVEPAYDGDPIQEISDEASLVWLAKQNGYSKDEFIQHMEEWQNGELDKQKHKFIESVSVELENAPSHMNAVVILGTMSLLEIARAQTEGVTVPRKSFCGLYDSWNGGGGPIQIPLNRDLYVPPDIIHSIGPDGYKMACSMEKCYGFTDFVWNTDFVANQCVPYSHDAIAKTNAFFCKLSSGSPLENEFVKTFVFELRNHGIKSVYEGMSDCGQLQAAAVRAIQAIIAKHNTTWRNSSPIGTEELSILFSKCPVPLDDSFRQWCDREVDRFIEKYGENIKKPTGNAR